MCGPGDSDTLPGLRIFPGLDRRSSPLRQHGVPLPRLLLHGSVRRPSDHFDAGRVLLLPEGTIDYFSDDYLDLIELA